MYDVIIVGGGPAGLNAALVLGRARRRVLVYDSGRYRNRASRALHGYLTRDGTDPVEFLQLARGELGRYPTVTVRPGVVVDAMQEDAGFCIRLVDGQHATGRKLILATGVVDVLPAIEGAEAFLGRGVYHCPYCDGWEQRDQPLAIYGRGDDKGAGMALELTLWSRDLALCTDGPAGLSPEYCERLERFGIPVYETPIARLEGRDDHLEAIAFRDGTRLARHALFFNTDHHQASDLAARLGCDHYGLEGCRLDNRRGKTNVPGLYVIGDASRDVLQIVVAAAEGCEAAVSVNTELLHDDGVLGQTLTELTSQESEAGKHHGP